MKWENNKEKYLTILSLPWEFLEKEAQSCGVKIKELKRETFIFELNSKGEARLLHPFSTDLTRHEEALFINLLDNVTSRFRAEMRMENKKWDISSLFGMNIQDTYSL